MDMDNSTLDTYQLISSTERVRIFNLLPFNLSIISPETENIFSQIDFVMFIKFT